MRDGLLFPVGDVDRQTATVELALRDPDLRATLAARALRKVQGPLSAAASAATLADLVDSLVHAPTKRESGPAAARAVV